MLDVRSGQKRFKRVYREQAAIFGKFSGVNLPDRNSAALEKGQNASFQNINGVQRAFRGIQLGKGKAGIAVHYGLDIDAFRPGKIADSLHPAKEK